MKSNKNIRIFRNHSSIEYLLTQIQSEIIFASLVFPKNMSLVKTIFRGYQKVERPISINAAFFLLINYYMDQEGFADFEVAEVLSWRFLAVALFAFPLGLFIKGRRLKPFFYCCAATLPIYSFLVIYAIQLHHTSLVYAMSFLWGASFIFMEVAALPYIVLNAKKETHSESFSLKFLAFSGSLTLVGFLNFVLYNLDPDFFDEKRVLQIFAGVSALSLFFISRINVKENVSEKIPLHKIRSDYDWNLIFRAVIPTLIIAIGAGFTIPVINLFFLKIHGMPSEQFSLMGSITFLLVICVMIVMPYIRRRFGYKIAIILFQSFAVLALFIMATTEYYKDWQYAFYIAAFFYIIRQPLMNAAGPMTSELTMYYVGKKNQELISALNASIWSGSWFFSMKIFALLRQMEMSYVNIFLITVAFYTVGVVWYYILVRDYEQRTGDSGIV